MWMLVKKKKKKKKKDPNKPKVPQSAFLFFSTDKRKDVIAAYPGITFQDIAKKLGEMWKGFTEADKKPYEQKADRDRLRYKEEMEHYKPPVQQDSSDDDKKLRKEREREETLMSQKVHHPLIFYMPIVLERA